MGSVEARKSRASTLPITPGVACGTLNLSVLEDESRMAGIA
jgi:hypothetical protein